MLDLSKLGRTIAEARKAQGLTQEQLGSELGVSPQAVSRWENGESAPDIALVPDLCRILGISADTLLGVDGAIGLRALGSELAKRLSEQNKTKRDEALIDVLGQVFAGWNNFALRDLGCNIAFYRGDKGLDRVGVWLKKGLAFFAVGEMLKGEGPPPSTIEKLRSLLAPGHWELAMALLNHPAKEDELLDAGVASSREDLRAALEEMIDAELVLRDRTGYQLAPKNALLMAAALKALCKEDFDRMGTGFGIFWP